MGVLEAELREAVRVGRRAEVYRLTHVIAGRGRGSKNRVYKLPGFRPSIADWDLSLLSAANEGGMSAKKIDYEAEKEAMLGDLPPEVLLLTAAPGYTSTRPDEMAGL